jgi:hypothetical protein
MADLPTVGRFVGGAGYAALTEASLRALVCKIPACLELLRGDPADWAIREVGDGNLNLVFIVTSGAAGVVVKEARPYVRLVGESWPLPLDRAHFEQEALKVQEPMCRCMFRRSMQPKEAELIRKKQDNKNDRYQKMPRRPVEVDCRRQRDADH